MQSQVRQANHTFLSLQCAAMFRGSSLPIFFHLELQGLHGQPHLKLVPSEMNQNLVFGKHQMTAHFNLLKKQSFLADTKVFTFIWKKLTCCFVFSSIATRKSRHLAKQAKPKRHAFLAKMHAFSLLPKNLLQLAIYQISKVNFAI